jgi:proline iminopeptidase
MKKAYFLIGVLALSFAQLLAQTNYVITRPDNVTLYVNEYGAGKPVILLGGGPGLNPGYLVPICQNMTGYRFIIPHQRGSGQSKMDKVDSLNMSTDKYVEDLEALRIQLKLSKLIIAGHSWGGMLGFAYAAKYPDKVDRLILLGPGGITSTFFTYFDSNIQMRLHEEDNEEAKKSTAREGGLKAIIPGYFFNRERALIMKNMLDSTLMNRNQSAIYKFTIKSYTATQADRVKDIRKYKNPVYIIQGRQDPIGESTVYETKEALPQTKFTFIEECGHFPWLEEEKAVAEFYQLLNSALKN